MKKINFFLLNILVVLSIISCSTGDNFNRKIPIDSFMGNSSPASGDFQKINLNDSVRHNIKKGKHTYTIEKYSSKVGSTVQVNKGSLVWNNNTYKLIKTVTNLSLEFNLYQRFDEVSKTNDLLFFSQDKGILLTASIGKGYTVYDMPRNNKIISEILSTPELFPN